MILDVIPLLSQDLFYPTKLWNDDGSWVQNYELSDNDEEFSISLEVPGFKASDLSVTVDEQKIQISGIRSILQEKGKAKDSSFRKVFAVDAKTTDLEKLTACVEDGMLKVTAPKKPKPSPVSVKVSTDSESVLEAEKSLSSSDKYAVSVDVPGIRSSDLSVMLHSFDSSQDETTVEILGIRHKNMKDGRPAKKARINKIFTLNTKTVDTSQLKAALADGVLTVYAPTKPKPEPLSINVSTDSLTFENANDAKKNPLRYYVDVPGIKAADLSLKLMDDCVLYITGSRCVPGSSNKTNFVKTLSFDPDLVEVLEIKASISDGVLTIAAPRKLKPEARVVPIMTGSISASSPESMDDDGKAAQKIESSTDTAADNQNDS